MKREFGNDDVVAIGAGAPSEIRSSIEVQGLRGRVRDVTVTLDVDHTWTEDLEIFLVAPNGERALLVGGQGGSGDNFKGTVFDDAATASIFGAAAPFRGTFQPQESLTRFQRQEPNGTWTLHVEDRQFLDGGRLSRWSLGIETCCNELENSIPVPIDPGPPNTVYSFIEVTSLTGQVIDDLNVTVDIDHTWDRDLTVALVGPDGERVVLVDREGGSRDDFRGTVFDDEAERSIRDGSAPFGGRFRPEVSLAAFDGKLANGVWALEVTDHAEHDGGQLTSWALEIMTKDAERPPGSKFSIDVRFVGGLTPNQRSVFQLAAARWAALIVGDLPAVLVDGEAIDDVVILAQGTAIDGRSGILGQAGPTHLRAGSLLPARGIMSFDSADLGQMEEDGTLLDVIVHEMGHVLGMGTIWSDLGYLEGAGTNNPVFLGANAGREYQALTGADEPAPVPVANTGGPGTRDGHWREAVFGNELMTGFVEAAENPVSRVTVGALEDMGYEVDYEAADAYQLPSSLALAAMGLSAVRADHGDHGAVFFPDRVVLPPNAYVDA